MDENDWNSTFTKMDGTPAKKRRTKETTELPEDTIDQSFLDNLMKTFKSMYTQSWWRGSLATNAVAKGILLSKQMTPTPIQLLPCIVE
jgi:hypothetical protein